MKRILASLVLLLAAAFTAQAAVYRAGFRQGRFWLNNSKTVPSFDQDAYAANSWDWTLSAMMCNVTGNAGASGVNPVSGNTWDWQNYYGYVYDGEMWMEAGTTYTLGGNFDDGSAILIDGAVAWAQGDPGGTGSGYNNWVAPRTYTPDATGWHAVKLLVWDWEGGKAITCDALSATMWNTNGTTTATPTSAWSKFQDDGSGSLFRAKLADTYLHVVTAGATAGGYAVTVENLAPQAVEMKIFAGTADLGETDTGWTSESQAVSFAAGETKDIEFAWTAGGMPVYRILLSGTDASLQAYGDFWEWSEVRTFLVMPSIDAAFVSTNDTSATVSVTCGYAESMTGSSPDIAVTAYYGRTNGGHDPSAWDDSRTYTAMQPGTFTDTFTCLLGTRCSVVFAASIGGGEPVWSDVLTFGVTLISPSDFAYRAEVTFPGFTGETPLGNFPALVRLAETPGGFSYAQAAAGGADLRFALADGTPLDSEIAVWDETGESLVWVHLPELASNTSVIMYWGGTDTSFPDSQTDGSVWGDASYVGVWHLEESGDTLADATANGLDGTRHGTVGRVAAGLAGAGHRISDGSSGVGIGIPNYDALSVGNSFTISAWFVYPQGQTPGYDRVFSRKSNYNDGNGWEVTLRNGSKQNLDHRGANGDAQDSAVFADIADGQWHYLAVAYNGNTSSVFVDGVQKVSGKTIGAAATDNGKLLVFGNNAAYAETTFKGTFDEIRLRDAVTDAAWAAAEWASVSDPAFAAVGPVEAIDLDLPDIMSPSDVATAHHAVSFAWTLRDAGTSASTVVAELGTESGVYTRTVTLDSGLANGTAGTATISGLQCATTYFLRLSASNASGTSSATETTFTTPGGVSFSGESLAVSGASAMTAAATVSSANPDATVAVSLLFGAAGATPAVRQTWTAATNPQTFTESVSGLLLGSYEAHFEAEATCSVCTGVSTASSETVSATLAGECRWTGAAGDFFWNTPGNWNSGTVPGPLDTAVFGSEVSGDVPVSFVEGASVAVQAIRFETSHAVTLGSAGGPALSSAALVVANGAGTVSVGAEFVFASSTTITAAEGTQVVFTKVSGTGDLLVEGAGTVNLGSQPGSRTGGETRVVGGTLLVSNNRQLGTGLVVGGGEGRAVVRTNGLWGDINPFARGNCRTEILRNGFCDLATDGQSGTWSKEGTGPIFIQAGGGMSQGKRRLEFASTGVTNLFLEGSFEGSTTTSIDLKDNSWMVRPSTATGSLTVTSALIINTKVRLLVEDVPDAPVDLTLTGGISYGWHPRDAFLKMGDGVLRLTAASTYGGGGALADGQGTTIVRGGTLLVDNTTGSGTGNSPVSVEAGAVLGGTGRIGGLAGTITHWSGNNATGENARLSAAGAAGAPAVVAPGTIDPVTGAHVCGTLTVGSEDLASSATFGANSALRVSIGEFGAADSLFVYGSLDLSGNSDALELTLDGKRDRIRGGRYVIASATEGISGSFESMTIPRSVRVTVEPTRIVAEVPPPGTVIVVR